APVGGIAEYGTLRLVRKSAWAAVTSLGFGDATEFILRSVSDEGQHPHPRTFVCTFGSPRRRRPSAVAAPDRTSRLDPIRLRPACSRLLLAIGRGTSSPG